MSRCHTYRVEPKDDIVNLLDLNRAVGKESNVEDHQSNDLETVPLCDGRKGHDQLKDERADIYR